MYCQICGAEIPEGLTQCPKCADIQNQLVGQTFGFHYESGMSSNTTTEIEHAITFQETGLLIERQKSYSLFRKRSRPVVTRTVPYQAVQSVRLVTGMAMTELVTAVGFGVLGLYCLFGGSVITGLILLAVAALSVKYGIRTMITIYTADGNPVRIPYSGTHRADAIEFLKAICLITGVPMPEM